MTYVQAVQELEALGIMPTGLPKLEPMQRALSRAGLTPKIPPQKSIIIAGTNGKGSTAATLSRLLVHAGQSVGLYTSPHLITTRERIRINDEDLSEKEFTNAYQKLKNLIREERLTHFEALTLITAFAFYQNSAVEWSIWEVGLGGLYDATNAIPHNFCAITKLGMDHEAILGRTLPEIAFQKFGVIEKEAVVVYSPMSPELEPLRNEVAAKTNCRWIEAELFDLPALCLAGERARENTATALTLFKALGFEPQEHLGALSEVRWPGRFSAFGQGRFSCPAFVSGDHNPQGIDSLIDILGHHRWDTLHLLVGIGKDKSAEGILEKLRSLPRVKLYLTETPFKPLALNEYPRRFRDLAVAENRDPAPLLSMIHESATPADLIVATGSLYLVGEILNKESSSETQSKPLHRSP